MQLTQSKTFFSISSDGVQFDFPGTAVPTEQNGLFCITAEGAVPVPTIRANDRLLLPIDEGIAITAQDTYAPGEFDCSSIGGTFCSREGTLDMIIVEREKKFLLIALESGIHAEYHAQRTDGLYQLCVTCFKPTRICYGIFSSLKAACKCYRETRTDQFLSLETKMLRNPNIQKLAHGGIFWVWSNHYDEVMYSEENVTVSPLTGQENMLAIAKDLFENGVEHALFGLFFEGDSILSQPLYETFGYLSTQYDNYNDVLNPDLLHIIPDNRVRNCDYTARRIKDYPDGVQIKEDGSLMPAWALKGFDGVYHNQNTLCPAVALCRMKEEIPEILKKYPFYKGRFIDVFGGSLSECCSPAHPLTKEECLNTKKDAFSFLGDIGLIAGTEDGYEAIVNHLVYTEGLHSPVYFRNKDSGRNHANMYSDAQKAHIEKHMVNPACRVPLWQLVHHEDLLSLPYWGDSTEMSPALIKRKIMFACLYGCPPLYSFSVKDYPTLRDSILTSYMQITAIMQKIAALPMTDYNVLRDDYTVQRTVFGGKYEITANFSKETYENIPPNEIRACLNK